MSCQSPEAMDPPSMNYSDLVLNGRKLLLPKLLEILGEVLIWKVAHGKNTRDLPSDFIGELS